MRIGVALVALVIAGAAIAQDYEYIESTAYVAGAYAIGSGYDPGVRIADGFAYENLTNGPTGGYKHGGSALISGLLTTKYVADDIYPDPWYVGKTIFQLNFTVVNYNTVEVGARMRLRLHAADGAGGGPGTYITGWSFVARTYAANTWYNFYFNPNVNLPASPFWVGLTFDNNTYPNTTAEQLDNFGQMLFNPPTVGSSNDIFFSTNAASTGLVSNPAGSLLWFGGDPVANFGFAFQVVPEPGSIAALATGLVGLLALRRRK